MRPTGEVSILAMTTGIRLLEPNNVDVQQTFEDIFYSIDDTGLWAVIFDTYGSGRVVATFLRAGNLVKITKKGSMEENFQRFFATAIREHGDALFP